MLKLSEDRINLLKEMLEDGLSSNEIADMLDIKPSSARRQLRYVKALDSDKKVPKVLLFDIETVMMETFIWNGKYKQTIDDHQIITDWNMLAWSAKWLFDSKIMSDIQTSKEAINRDDKRIVNSLWELLDKANVIIGHNGDRFDIRKTNARCIEHSIPPPSPYQTIDTLKIAKRHFAFSSYKLDFLAKKFGVGGKIESGGYDLWKRCIKGDKKSLDHMNKYNIQDTLLLEEVYLRLRPWAASHPNLALYLDLTEKTCGKCLGTDFEDKGNYYTTNVNMYKALRCKNCGSFARLRQSAMSKNNKKHILAPISR